MFRNKDVAGGALLVGLGAVSIAASYSLPFGTPLRMGPGYFPMVLSALLLGLGGLVLFQGLKSPAERDKNVNWRGALPPLAAPIFFAFSIQPLGFLAALAGSVLISSAAAPRITLVSALLLTAGITALCWLVFIVGLELPIPSIGPWLRG